VAGARPPRGGGPPPRFLSNAFGSLMRRVAPLLLMMLPE